MTDQLTNPRRDRVRSLARLSGRSARRKTGLFLAEGPSCTREALAAGAAQDVYATAEALTRHPDLPELAQVAGAGLFECAEEVLAALADTITPQGVVTVARIPSIDLDDVLAGQPRLVAVLSHVRDPGNAGTVIRAADATGADAVILTDGSVDPYNPKCVRSTTGSLFHLPVVVGGDLGSICADLRAAGCVVLAADGTGDADLDDLADAAHQGSGPLAGPTAWVFGNEAWGMTESERALADQVVRVPIKRAESLNLAMAATVCLFASARAHR